MTYCNNCPNKDICKHSNQGHYTIKNGNIQKCFSFDLKGFREAQKYIEVNNLNNVAIKYIES